MDVLKQRGYTEALKDYIMADRPFLGVCLGLQLLFDGSEESNGCEGLGLVPGTVAQFDTSLGLPVPHIGWNDLLQKCVWVHACLPALLCPAVASLHSRTVIPHTGGNTNC